MSETKTWEVTLYGRPLPMTHWHPIDDPDHPAPRDGRCVDIWCYLRGLSSGAYGRIPDAWFSAGKWWRYDELHGDGDCRSEVHNVTHWTPRPPPPKDEGK